MTEEDNSLPARLKETQTLRETQAFADDINAQFQKATAWTPARILGLALFAAGMALLGYLAQTSPSLRLLDSSLGILTTILMIGGGLLASWRYVLFQWYRWRREGQYLARAPYGWTAVLAVISVLALIVFLKSGS